MAKVRKASKGKVLRDFDFESTDLNAMAREVLGPSTISGKGGRVIAPGSTNYNKKTRLHKREKSI